MWPCWFNSSQMAVLLRSMSLQGWWPFFLCFQQEQVTQVAGPCYHHGENLCLPSLFIWSRKNSLRTALALGFLFWQKSTANFNCTVLRSIVTESNRMNYKNVMNIFFLFHTQSKNNKLKQIHQEYVTVTRTMKRSMTRLVCLITICGRSHMCCHRDWFRDTAGCSGLRAGTLTCLSCLPTCLWPGSLEH